MQLLCDPNERKFRRSLYDNHEARIPGFTIGETVALEVGIVNRTLHPWDSRLFTPIDPTDWTVRASLGKFREAIGGTFAIIYNLIPSTSLVPAANPAAGDIQLAINQIQEIIDAGGVVVSGDGEFFVLTFNQPGVRFLFVADASQAIPSLLLEFKRLVTGDLASLGIGHADVREVQSLRISQNVASLATLDTDSAAPAATVDVLTAGDGTHSQKVRVNLPAGRWGGGWMLTVAGQVSDLLGWDDGAELLQIMVEAITGVGLGNVNVSQDSDDSFILLFKGALANMAITVTADGSTLKTLQTKSGTLDLRNEQVEFLLDGEKSTVVTLEIELTPPSGTPEKILRDVLLSPPVIQSSSTIPPLTDSSDYYTKEQIDALFAAIGTAPGVGQFPDIAVNAAGTHDLAPVDAFTAWFQLVNVQAGAGAYVHNITLDNSQAVEGSIFRVELDLAQSTNPTINIYDESTGGTLLQTVVGVADSATYFLFEARFDGTSWVKFNGEYIT